MSANTLRLTAAHARPGLPIAFYLSVGGKEIYTGGVVTKAVKSGDAEITITTQHHKTGEMHTNVLRAGKTIYLYKAQMAKMNPHLFGSLALMARTTFSILNGADYFETAEIGAELSQESSMPPGVTPQTITF